MKNTLVLIIVCLATFINPDHGQWTNPTAPAEKREQSTFQNCIAYLYFPAGEFTKTIVLEYYGKCTNGLAEGYKTINAREQDTNDTVVMTSNFAGGYAIGDTQFSSSNGLSFSGNLHKDGSYIGKLKGPDGLFFDGEIRASKPYTAVLEQENSQGGSTLYFLKGVLVNQSEYLASQSYKIQQNVVAGDGPSDEASITEDIEDYSIQQSTHNPTMATFNLNGSKKCQADLPSKIYKITADFPGRCIDGLYTGKADLTLIPRIINTALKMSVSLRYEAGQIIGPVKATYVDLRETYVGDMVNWLPSYGEYTKDIGNRNFQITPWYDGKAGNPRVEYRPPSEAELAIKRMVIGIATAAVDCYVVGTCKDQRQYERRAYKAEQARNDDLAAQATNQRLRRENAARIAAQEQATVRADADRSANTSPVMQYILLDGTPINPPISPVAGASNDPLRERPAITTNEQEFGGTTSPPVETTAPSIPEPNPTAPSIPNPIIRDEPTGPAQDVGIPNPVIGDADATSPPIPPPVQPVPQSDTLGTGPVPSNPVPAPSQVSEPTPPTQPAVDAVSRPAPTPVNNTAANQTTSPSVPYGLAPSGSSSTPAIVTNPVILRWQAVTGADSYDFGISSEASGYQLVVDQRLRETFYSGSLSPGKYRWNLRACNNQSVCSAFASQQYFEIPGAGNAQADTQSTLSPPTQLYPTNQGELAFPVPIEWNRVTGATSYKVNVRDVTDNIAIANDEVTTSNTFTPRNQKAGHYYEWNVQACNASGCSVRSKNAGFRTVGASRSDSCKIEVRFKPIRRPAEMYNHAFIVTSDSNSTTYFRGGPEFPEQPTNFGRIVTESGSYLPGTIDWIDTPSGIQVIARIPSNCDEIDRKFANHLRDIANAAISYKLVSQNSNSTIREVLERAGHINVSPVVKAPAWYSQLP